MSARCCNCGADLGRPRLHGSEFGGLCDTCKAPGHPWTCVCGACLQADVAFVGQSKMAERLAAIAGEVLRLRALIRANEDEAFKVMGPVEHEAGSVVAELLDIIRAAVVQDGGP